MDSPNLNKMLEFKLSNEYKEMVEKYEDQEVMTPFHVMHLSTTIEFLMANKIATSMGQAFAAALLLTAPKIFLLWVKTDRCTLSVDDPQLQKERAVKFLEYHRERCLEMMSDEDKIFEAEQIMKMKKQAYQEIIDDMPDDSPLKAIMNSILSKKEDNNNTDSKVD